MRSIIRSSMLVVWVAIVFGAVMPEAARAGLREQAAVQDLRTALGGEVVVVTDPEMGQAIAMRGLAVPLSAGRTSPGEAALRWCSEHAAVFGLRSEVDELRLRTVELRRTGLKRVTLEQWYQGVPVVGGESRAVVDREGRLIAVASGARPGILLDVNPQVPASQAIVSVASALAVRLSEHPGTARLAIRADELGERLAWEVTIASVEGRSVRSWVDAQTGALLALDDGISHASGLAYPIDPRGSVVQVPLAGLAPGTGLASSLLRVEDSLYPAATADGNGDFRVTPDQPTFDQVNAYYHVSHFLRDGLERRLGMTPLAESLVVRVQFRTDPFVAFTSGRFIFLGRPIPGFVREVARAADIVIHETVHAVLYGNDIQPTSLRREAGALHEGLADYFAAVATGDPAIGEWLYLPFPNGSTRVDMPLPAWHMSNYDRIGFAGGEAASPWGNGMILSATLWDLRASIGEAADSLIIESFDALPSAPQWGHFANAMILADVAHHGGRFADAISRAFTQRGVRGAIEAEIAVVGPNTLTTGQTGTFSTTGCCGGLPGSYEWRARSWCRGGPCGDFESIANGPTLTLAPESDIELRVRVIGPWGDTLLSAPHFVGVRLPELVIEGPRRLPRGTPGTWVARIEAVGPARVDWTRRYRTGSGDVEVLGVHDDVRFAPTGSFDLVARLIDGLGRVTTRSILVETFVPGRVPEQPLALTALTTLAPGLRAATTRFELPLAGRLFAAVYDVRGRVRAKLADTAASPGAYYVHWDSSALESGVYFLKLRLEGSGERTERIAIVR